MTTSTPQAPPLWPRIAALAALLAVFCFLCRNSQIDDALIYARYIRNALSGQGLVFNPGEHVNALTSPLYSYLVLILAKLTGGRVLLAMALVSGSALFAACVLAELLFPFSGLLVASTAYFHLMVGMETSTFLLLLLLTVFLTLRERYNWLPTACILLLLTRFEGGALILALAVELYRRKRWPAPQAFIPPALLLLLYVALNRFWYGAFLPASAGAKFGQGRSGLWGRWPTAFLGCAYQLKPDFKPELEVVILVAILAVVGIVTQRRTAWQRLVLPTVGILLAFYVFANIPGYRWYFAPFIFFAMLYACAALPRFGRWQYAAIPVIAVAAVTSFVFLQRTYAPQDPTKNYPGIAAWLEQNSPSPTLEAAEIGTLGWQCPHCRIIDIVGLTTPKNADHIAHRDLTSWLAEDQPDFIVVHNAPWAYEDVAKHSADYQRVPVDFGPMAYLLWRKMPKSIPEQSAR